jgi:DnaJ-class molecular chaperone
MNTKICELCSGTGRDKPECTCPKCNGSGFIVGIEEVKPVEVVEPKVEVKKGKKKQNG